MKTFTLTESHIKLVRAMAPSVMWWEAGGDWEIDGAPAVNRLIPYGSRLIPKDIHRILGDDIPEEECYRLHSQTGVALQIILSTGEFAPGEYEADESTVAWRKVQ